MKTLVIKASVDFPGGGKHWQETGWVGVGQAEAQLTKAMAEATHLAKSLGGKGGDLTATLEATIDGVVQTPVVVPGVTRDALVKFQKHAHKVQGELIALGEHAAKLHQQHGQHGE